MTAHGAVGLTYRLNSGTHVLNICYIILSVIIPINTRAIDNKGRLLHSQHNEDLFDIIDRDLNKLKSSRSVV